jgi:hypothetical protein
MALSTDQYGYLIDPLVPITDATGTTIKDGFLRVYIAGSSTPVFTYRNYDGAANEQTIELDNSGRCKYPVIVNKSLAYKVVVYDAQHSQETPIITVDKMFAIGASATAGAGSTIVQGLDNVEGESDGFVKASVTGTTANVKLDATNVSHELTGDAAVGYAASAGYMIPALSNDPDDPGDPQKLPLAWIWANRSTQVVLTPADFLGAGLSNDEWAAAVAAISGGKTAVVKWTESGASRVAVSSRYEAGVGLVFVAEYGGFVTEYVVAAAPGAHAVTTNVYEMAESLSIARFDVMWDIDGNDYVFPAAQDVIDAVGSYIEVQLLFHSPAGVNFVYALTYKSTVHYEWTREDCQSKFNLDGAGSPTVWTWTADDTRIKQDVSTLDTDIGKIGGSIAPAYDPTKTYAVGDLVMYARRLYECTTDTNPEAWDSTHWTRRSVSDFKPLFGALAYGGVLTDSATVEVPNNKLSTLSTSQSALTLNVTPPPGTVPNFAVEITASVACTVTVTSTVGGTTTTLKYAAAAGNELEESKIYQLTCVGSCWTLAEFAQPTP